MSYLWSEERYKTQADTERAIAEQCVSMLCDADLGAVIGDDGKEYNIEVTAQLIPVE